MFTLKQKLSWALLAIVLFQAISLFVPLSTPAAYADHLQSPSLEWGPGENNTNIIRALFPGSNNAVPFQFDQASGVYREVSTPGFTNPLSGDGCTAEIRGISPPDTSDTPVQGELVVTSQSAAGLPCNSTHQTFSNLAVGGSTIDPTDPTDPAAEEETIPSCTSQGGSTAWIACPIIEMMLGALRTISTFMAEILSVKPLSATDTESPIYTVWSNVRNIALGVLVIATIIAIFGQTLGIDAYTVKKMVPRIGIGAVLIMVSYYICAILIDFFNVLGIGVQNLMLESVEGLDITVGVGAWLDGVVLGLAAGGFIVLLANPALLATIGLILLPVLLAFLTALITVILRQIVIISLVVVAPLAFAAWILPTTDKWFKRWYSTLSTMLMMFPLIMIVLGAGAIYAVIVTNGGNLTSSKGINGSNLANYLLAIAGLGISMGMIPFTMKASSGILKGAVSAINNPNRGPIDRLRKGLQGRREFGKDARRQERLKTLGDLDRTNPKGKSLQKGWLRATTGTLGYGRGYKGLQRAEAVTGARSVEQRKFLAESKAEQEQGQIADFQLQKEVADRTASGEDMEKIKADLAERAGKNAGSAEQGAAFRHLVTLKAVSELEAVFDNAGASGDAALRQSIDKLKGQNFGQLHDFAAHLSTGSYDLDNNEFKRNYASVGELPAEQLVKQKPEVIRGAMAESAQLAEKIMTTYANTAPHQRTPAFNQIMGEAAHGVMKTPHIDPATGKVARNIADKTIDTYSPISADKMPSAAVIESVKSAVGTEALAAAVKITGGNAPRISAEGIQNLVQARGGIGNLSDAELGHVAAHHSTVEIGQQAAAELSSRGRPVPTPVTAASAPVAGSVEDRVARVSGSASPQTLSVEQQQVNEVLEVAARRGVPIEPSSVNVGNVESFRTMLGLDQPVTVPAARRVSRQQVKAMGESNVQAFIQDSGGYGGLHQGELLSIANEYAATDTGRQARQELANRGGATIETPAGPKRVEITPPSSPEQVPPQRERPSAGTDERLNPEDATAHLEDEG